MAAENTDKRNTVQGGGIGTAGGEEEEIFKNYCNIKKLYL